MPKHSKESNLIGPQMSIFAFWQFPTCQSVSRVYIWPFLKLCAKNKIGWPFGFLDIRENSIF